MLQQLSKKRRQRRRRVRWESYKVMRRLLTQGENSQAKREQKKKKKKEKQEVGGVDLKKIQVHLKELENESSYIGKSCWKERNFVT